MVTVKMKTSGPMNRNSILSVNIPEPQSVKNKNTITSIIKNTQNNAPTAQQTHAQTQPRSVQQTQPRSMQQTQPYTAQQTQPYTAQQTQPRATQQTQSRSMQTQPYTAQQTQPRATQQTQPRSMQQTQPYTAQQTSSRPPARTPQQQNIQPALTAGQQNPNGAPIARPVPTLQNKVQKGQKTLLSTAALTAVDACFGWNVTDARCDVDVSAFLLGADGKVIGDSWFVFYGQPLSPDQSTKFVASGGADRERIEIDFGRLNPQVQKIVFVLTINEALADKLHFGMLKDAYVRIMDPSGRELVSFLMTEYYNNVISMMIGELYQHNGAWKFNAIGNGVARDLAGLCELYGVQVL